MAIFKIIGTICERSQITTGTSKTGNEWQKMSIVVDCSDSKEKYENHVAIDVFGEDKINQIGNIKDGDIVEIAFTINAREYNGRWYNNMSFWNYEPMPAPEKNPAPKPAPENERRRGRQVQPEPQAKDNSLEPQEEDLPF